MIKFRRFRERGKNQNSDFLTFVILRSVATWQSPGRVSLSKNLSKILLYFWGSNSIKILTF